MEQNTYGFIGLGLIGGSLAKALKRTDPSCRILAYTRTRATLEEALKAQAVDAACSSVDDPQFATCSCIFLCAPVATNISALRVLKDIVSPDNLFRFQSELIRELADNESCIIIGRCADYVLKDHDNCVHVFVCGDMDSKVQRMMHSYSLEESAAVERIKETDKQRKKYYSYYTGGDWEAASNYDLCLNTGDMSIEEAAEQILFYLKQKKYI